MEKNKNIEMLPCFRHIAAKLSPNNSSMIASFALAFIQYVEKTGLVEPSEIEEQFYKLTLLSQFNPTSTESIDFLTFEGKTYSLSSLQVLEEYKQVLLRLCKRPKSFSALYKGCDTKLQSCKFCPMSTQYTRAHRDEELRLFGYALAGSKQFWEVVSCFDDIDTLFQSFDDLYEIFPNIVKPVAFPGMKLLLQTIYQDVDKFFHPILQMSDFSPICDGFEKKLRANGVNPKTVNLKDTYAADIYNYYCNLISSKGVITSENASALRGILLNRTPYIPPIDADAIPQIKITKTDKKKKTSTTKKGKKDIGTCERISSTTLAMDMAMGLDVPLKEYKVEGSLETDEKKDIPVPSDAEFANMELEILAPETADILSPDGDVIVEHALETNSTIVDFEDDEDIDFELDDDEDDDLKEKPLFKNEDIEPAAESVGSTEGSDADGISETDFNPSHDTYSEHSDNDSDNNTEDNAVQNEFDIYREDLRYPLHIDVNSFDSTLGIIQDGPAYDRVISYALLDGFAVVELVTDEKDTWLFVGAKGHRFLVMIDASYSLELLRFHKLTLFSTRPLALYYYLTQAGSSLRKGRIVPISKLLYLDGAVKLFEKPLAFYDYVYPLALNYYSSATDAIWEKEALLSNVYGVSLYRNRFLQLDEDNFAVTYDDKGNPIMTAYDMLDTMQLQTDGCVLQLTYHEIGVHGDAYQRLTRMVLLELANKGCFSKFALSVLSCKQASFVLFADEYCMDYIYNILLVLLFEFANKLSISPLDVSLRKRAALCNIVK